MTILVSLDQRGITRWKDDVPPRSDFRTSIPSLNDTIVLEAILFLTRSSFAPVMFRRMMAPVIFHVPRIVPVTPWERVVAINPVECVWHSNVPSPEIDTVSFSSPTVPCQLPTIFVEYSASGTGAELWVQDKKQTSKTTVASTIAQRVQ